MAKKKQAIKHPYLQVWRAKDGDWQWHTTAANSNILAKSSEGYEQHGGAVEGYVDSATGVLRSTGMSEDYVQDHIEVLRERLSAELVETSRAIYRMSIAPSR